MSDHVRPQPRRALPVIAFAHTLALHQLILFHPPQSLCRSWQDKGLLCVVRGMLGKELLPVGAPLAGATHARAQLP